MPKLLVSVRSAAEARAASLGGASIIDVKEPFNGPLGRAEPSVWRAVLDEVGLEKTVSVALGELAEPFLDVLPSDFDGLAFRKVGLAGSGKDWREAWASLRERLGRGPSWVAVVYADWRTADAPDPDEILEEALAIDDCSGVLVDTYDKTRPSPIDLTWRDWFERARIGGRFTALAGSLNPLAIERLGPLEPDIIAVRGAACLDGDRRRAIDPERVALLARQLSSISV